jgi:geranylgeranyl pyrophosphate synthase
MMDPKLAANVEAKCALVESALEAFARQDAPVANLDDGLAYALGLDLPDRHARGKRIRPALCLLTCEALGGQVEQALSFAMAVELMHNFFLVHDDIEDGDEFRRARPSVWKRFGLAHGINIGDYLLTKVFAAFLSGRAHLAGDLRIALLQLTVDTLERTEVGQTLDMNARARDHVTMAQYLEIVANKTGYYLAAPMVGGALVAGAAAPVVEAVRAFGRQVGPVFQIVDDVIDLTEGKGREAVGSDIREGKRSFLVAHTAARASEAEQRRLFEVLDLPREATGKAEVEEVAALFARYGAVEAARANCREMMDAARSALAPAPERLRQVLVGVFEDLLERKR